MTRSLELTIAMRYLRARRGSRLLSFISLIAIGGVVVGVSVITGVTGCGGSSSAPTTKIGSVVFCR